MLLLLLPGHPMPWWHPKLYRKVHGWPSQRDWETNHVLNMISLYIYINGLISYVYMVIYIHIYIHGLLGFNILYIYPIYIYPIYMWWYQLKWIDDQLILVVNGDMMVFMFCWWFQSWFLMMGFTHYWIVNVASRQPCHESKTPRFTRPMAP